MQFIETERGLLSVADINEIRRLESGYGEAIFNKGNNRAQTHDKYQDLVEFMGPVIADTTGIFGLMTTHDSETDEVVGCSRIPIVAWRLTAVGARPIFADNNNHDAILYPSGEVECHFNFYNGVEEFLEQMEENRKRKSGQ
ncbi:hypothetical protein [Falsigemmobacter faecalis]|uniref:Uncharacterized protein n=1 Tax=Falsigemmobacter faecalis TaxID=2488730 RepID=A0A3P3DCH3_9RHOB|nr:hypothetical protein [Falsigemmobacter faecalis]RRH72010.1 hypothetical protein EG244_15970 [Falsigemmobacter faecalis]